MLILTDWKNLLGRETLWLKALKMNSKVAISKLTRYSTWPSNPTLLSDLRQLLGSNTDKMQQINFGK